MLFRVYPLLHDFVYFRAYPLLYYNISGSSSNVMANFFNTAALAIAIKSFTFAAVAPPVFTMKFGCFSDIAAPPRVMPRKPDSEISFAADITGKGSVFTVNSEPLYLTFP